MTNPAHYALIHDFQIMFKFTDGNSEPEAMSRDAFDASILAELESLYVGGSIYHVSGVTLYSHLFHADKQYRKRMALELQLADPERRWGFITRESVQQKIYELSMEIEMDVQKYRIHFAMEKHMADSMRKIHK